MCGVQGSRVQGTGFKATGFKATGYRVQGYRIQGTGKKVVTWSSWARSEGHGKKAQRVEV